MKAIINCIISWNYLNRELFAPYGLNPEDQRPKAISFDAPANVTDLDAGGHGKVDMIYFHEKASMNSQESKALANIYAHADKVFTIIHEPILKTWEGLAALNQMVEGKPCFPAIPTHSTHGPYIDLMYEMAASYQQGNRAGYDAQVHNLRSLAGAQPERNRRNAHFNAAFDIMNRTLKSGGPGRVLWMADQYEDLFIREMVNKPGVRELLEEMERQYELEAPVVSLRTELHRLLFATDQ